MPDNARGITLLQMVVVVAFLGGMWLIRSFVIMPMLERAQVKAEESAAIGSLRMIGTAELTFSTASNSGYTSSLGDLTDRSAAPGAESRSQIDPELASGVKNGYRYLYTPKIGAADSSYVGSFTVQADPIDSRIGERHFFMDESLVIHANVRGQASPSDPGL